MLQTSPEDEYRLDDLGRICPVHQGGWTRDRWQNASSFDEAMGGVAALAMTEAFLGADRGLSAEELSDLRAKRYLDTVDGFYLATAADPRLGVFRFTWENQTFFSMRPDFVIRSLVTDVSEAPINALESAVRTRLMNYHQELDALKYALAKGEIDAMELYPIEFWMEFWKVRGIAVAEQISESTDGSCVKKDLLKPNERNTLLTIIAALCKHAAIDPASRGAAVQVARLTEVFGVAVSDDTVRRFLAKIPEALESRSK